MCKQVCLCIFIGFLCLIGGSCPSACLFCPILLCSFLFILLLSLRRPFSNERQEGVNLGGEQAEEELGGIVGGDSKIKI